MPLPTIEFGRYFFIFFKFFESLMRFFWKLSIDGTTDVLGDGGLLVFFNADLEIFSLNGAINFFIVFLLIDLISSNFNGLYFWIWILFAKAIWIVYLICTLRHKIFFVCLIICLIITIQEITNFLSYYLIFRRRFLHMLRLKR